MVSRELPDNATLRARLAEVEESSAFYEKTWKESQIGNIALLKKHRGLEARVDKLERVREVLVDLIELADAEWMGVDGIQPGDLFANLDRGRAALAECEEGRRG